MSIFMTHAMSLSSRPFGSSSVWGRALAQRAVFAHARDLRERIPGLTRTHLSSKAAAVRLHRHSHLNASNEKQTVIEP
jgi:hypothetical protein